MKYELKNEQLTVGFETKGAEMISLRGNKSGKEYLWNADAKFWGRHSPVLFPIVDVFVIMHIDMTDRNIIYPSMDLQEIWNSSVFHRNRKKYGSV
nr:hypothetical protein [Roseburia sp. MSJ-14]